MLERRRGHVVIVSGRRRTRLSPRPRSTTAPRPRSGGFAEALRLELAGSGVSVTTVYPGEIETSCIDHEWDRMPAWYHRDRRSPPGPLADQMVTAVEQDRRELLHPPLVRLLRVVNGISPGLADLDAAPILGAAAAPRRG